MPERNFIGNDHKIEPGVFDSDAEKITAEFLQIISGIPFFKERDVFLQTFA
jgi:hypothetical protein